MLLTVKLKGAKYLVTQQIFCTLQVTNSEKFL